jgi:hypothetical protein
MKSRYTTLACAAALFGIAACNSATAVDDSITQADVNQLASDVDALSMATLGDAGASPFFPGFSVSASGLAPSPAVTLVNRTFTNTHACPGGGTVTISGTTIGTSDPVAHNLAVNTVATKTDAACAFNSRRGLLTITGNPNVKLTSTIAVAAAKPVGPQTQTQKGSFTWTRGTRSGTCDVDIASVFNPTAGTFTVTGTMCGRTINVSRTGPTI